MVQHHSSDSDHSTLTSTPTPLLIMKLVIVLCLAALACAQSDKEAQIINQQFEINEDGSYDSAYETSNGIQASENGVSYPGNEPETGNYVRSGSYSYEWEGVTYTVNWQADENGFYAEGDHLPKAQQ